MPSSTTPASLPCLYNSVKCLEPLQLPPDYEEPSPQQFLIDIQRRERAGRWRRPIQPYHNRTADALIENGKHLSVFYGSEHIGFLTLTCRPRTTLKQARQLFGQLWKNHLSKRFLACISVLDLNKNRVPHIHALVALPFNIAEGFDFAAYEEMREQNRLLLVGAPFGFIPAKRRFNLTTNESLKAEWRWLRHLVGKSSRCAKGKRMAGFAPRFELCPLLEEPEAASKYLAKAFYSTRRATCGKIKRLRIIAYSGACDRCHSPRYVPIKSTKRFQYRRLGEALGVSEYEIGQKYERWSFHGQLVIDDLEQCASYNPDQWPTDLIQDAALKLMPLTAKWQDKEPLLLSFSKTTQ
jgi:hypothetical protein